MKRLIVYIILAAASLYIALIYRNESFLCIFYGQLIVIVLLAILNIASIRRSDIFMDVPEGVVQMGNKIPVSLTLYNSGAMPTGMFGIKIQSFNSYTGKKQTTKFYGSADSNASRVLKCYYYTKNPGNIEFCIKKIWSYDYFGILALPIKVRYAYKQQVIVIPELYDVPVRTGTSLYGYAEEDKNTQKNYNSTDDWENGGTRPYIPGDSFKSIHWKLSARTGELLAKEKASDAACAAVFFIVPGRIEDSYKKRCFLQAALSISESLLSNGCRHFICWYDFKDGGLKRITASKKNDSFNIVPDCLEPVSEKYEGNMDVFLLKKLYAGKYNGGGSASYLALNMEFELIVNGNLVARYDYRDLENSLLSVEIHI